MESNEFKINALNRKYEGLTQGKCLNFLTYKITHHFICWSFHFDCLI